MSELSDKWRELGRVFLQCADDLEGMMDSIGSEYSPESFNSKWPFLERHDLIMGNESSGYMASPILIELASHLSMNNTRRRVAPDIDSWFLELEKQVSLLHNSLAEQNQKHYQNYLQSINAHCWTMVCGLEDEIKLIDYYIQTEFGHVESVKEKRIENQHCIDNVTQYANKIVHLTVHQFSRLAHDNPDLNRIFFNKLVPVIFDCRERFTAAIPKLEKLLWTYRHYDQITQKVWAVNRLLSQGGVLVKSEVNDDELAQSPFNTIIPCSTVEYVDMSDAYDNQDLIDIVKSMCQRPEMVELINEDDETPKALIRDADDVIEIKENILKEYFRQFISETIETQCTALSFWDKTDEKDIPGNVWLIWAFTHIKKYKDISVELLTYDSSRFSNDAIIYDFEVSINEV